MTPSKLRSYTAKDLAQMARKRGVAGWHSMRKDDLIAALAGLAGQGKDLKAEPKAAQRETPQRKPRPTAAQRRLAKLQQERARMQDLSSPTPAAQRDQLVLLVRDPFWLQANWEIAPTSIARAKTALGQHWHGATPVLRLGRLGDDGAVTATRRPSRSSATRNPSGVTSITARSV